MYFIDAVFSLIIIYAYLFFSGAGFYLLFSPAALRAPLLLPFLAPTLGLSHLFLLATYLVAFGGLVTWLLPLSLVSSATLLVLGLALNRRIRDFILDLKKSRRYHWGIALACATAVLLVVISPAVRSGPLTVPFRVGHDQIQNVGVAQFFLNGGSLGTALVEDSLRKETLITKEAVEAMRWGVSAALAAFTQITGHDLPYRVAFLAVGLILVLISGIAYHFFVQQLWIPPFPALLGSLAMAGNCNLLNLVYEGFWAQTFAMPISFTMLILLLGLRSEVQPVAAGEKWKPLLLLSLLVSSLGTSFGEGVQLFLTFCVILILLDLILRRRFDRTNSIIIGAFALAFLYLIPVVPMLIRHYFKVADHYLKIGGFWQPLWALPSEIFGLSNIYSDFMSWFGPDFSPKLLPRSAASLMIHTGISLLLLGVFLRHIFRSSSVERPFWLAAPIFIAALGLVTYVTNQHNYLYMKSYTFFLPLLFPFLYAAVFRWSPQWAGRKPFFLSGAKYGLAVGIILVGLFHVGEYSRTSTVVSGDMLELYGLSQKREMQQAVFLPRDKIILDQDPGVRYRHWLLECMILPLFPVPFIDEWRLASQDFRGHLSQKVYLLLRKGDLPCPSCTLQKNEGKVVWQNGTFLVLDTGRIVADGISAAGKTPIDLRVFWTGL